MSQVRKVLLCNLVITFSMITCLADSDQHHWYDILTWKLAGDNNNSICTNHDIAAKRGGTNSFLCPRMRKLRAAADGLSSSTFCIYAVAPEYLSWRAKPTCFAPETQ